MRCTLVDTGPLVALLDERDALHGRALRELGLAPIPRLLTPPVLTETLHLLDAAVFRERLGAMVEGDEFQLSAPAHWPTVASRSLAWMQKYEAHEPDFADAYLIATYEHEAGALLWSFDSEFRTTWRTSKGKSLRLVPAK